MRLPALALLLLSAAAPAIAAGPDDDTRVERPGDERPSRAERAERRFERAERRSERSEPSFEPRAERAERVEPRFERPVPQAEGSRPVFDRVARQVERAEREGRQEPSAAPAREDVVQERRRRWSAPAPAGVPGETRPADSVSGWRWRERNAERRGRQPGDLPPTPESPVLAQPLPAPETAVRGADVARPAGYSERRMHEVLRNRVAAEGWRKEWRRDRRYDWRRHRDWDRGRFHLGIYIDPFGWRYRDWDLGWRLPYRYYSSRYWIRDPWYYRLPPVYGSYRWIRYHDDVLLVDLRTGRVIDRIRDFFW